MTLRAVLRSVGLAFLALICLSQTARQDAPDVAYSLKGVLYLATKAGQVIQTIKTEPPLSTFAISPDATTVIFAPRGQRGYGGPLYSLEVRSGKAKRLTKGPYFSKARRPDEVYSDPDFSPDGKQAIFAIHGQSSGDAVEASGPFAIIDLSTEQVRLLKPTMNLAFTGVAYANDPHWSPRGNEILLNFETGAAVLPASGESLRDLSGLMADSEWSHAIGWLGPACVVYVSGRDPNDADSLSVRLLNLKTAQSQLLGDAVNSLRKSASGVVAISDSVLARKDHSRLQVVTTAGAWEIPDGVDDVQVRMVGRGNDGWIPQPCK